MGGINSSVVSISTAFAFWVNISLETLWINPSKKGGRPGALAASNCKDDEFNFNHQIFHRLHKSGSRQS